MSKRKEHKPRVTESARHICGWSQEVHQGTIRGRPCPSSPGAWGPPVVVPWMASVASGTPYTFQKDSAPAHTAKLVQSWLKKNVPNDWDFNH
ncbi:Transposable element tcb1 transposase [Caligus rogercresseyi]|uniref:Transposable element tcb1 transposase n=1 Tax=Caligus rogercresseyi TaxID=217165 RepID=A0A7T8HL63_CALRO|nr:Transposable element tcb1 transposase [Caligus rogercresseyi]